MEEIADWFDSQGATREQFVTTFTSNAVLRRTASADALGRQLKIAGIPSLVINGKYLVGINREVGARRMLEVADYLINMENKTSTPATE